MRSPIKCVAVYCGSSMGAHGVFREEARRFGDLLAREGLSLVYGGGAVGLMGVVADAVLAGGGHVVGVIPEALRAREVDHKGISELIVAPDMHTRKFQMAERADAFVALPGGIGTFEEWFEVLTWKQLGIHPKPCALLNTGGFYDPLVGLLEHAVSSGFLKRPHLDSVIVEASPEALLQRLRDHGHEDVSKV